MSKNIHNKTMGSGILGFFVLISLIINTVFWTPVLFFLGILKFLMPFKQIRNILNKLLDLICLAWMSFNNFGVDKILKVKINLDIPEGLSKDKWYLVISNHQSWIDIVLLQRIFTYNIPMPKFFLKSQLIWVPLLGLAWWALDYPFMKRYTKSFIEKNPNLKGKDMEKTINACKKFSNIPVSIINFVEGTRITESKHKSQNSEFKHLLKPKAGGVGYVFTAMGDYVSSILDVTIVYPDSSKKLWDFMCGRIKNFTIVVKEIEYTDDLKGNYILDDSFKNKVQIWINELWLNKDKLIDKIKNQ